MSCKYNLLSDVTEAGSLRLAKAAGGDLVEIRRTMPPMREDAIATAIATHAGPSCALDVAERDGTILEEVGELLGLSKERVRQIQDRALAKLREQGGDLRELLEMAEELRDRPASPIASVMVPSGPHSERRREVVQRARDKYAAKMRAQRAAAEGA